MEMYFRKKQDWDLSSCYQPHLTFPEKLTFLNVFIKVLCMGADTRKESIIIAIKQKIRLLNVIAAFIVVTLLAVIFRYLYKPAGDVLSFLPDISITLVIAFVVFLTIISFYMWSVVARQIISTIEKYRNRIDQILSITKDLREEKYADILLNKIMEYSLSITRSDSGSILLLENNNLVFKAVKGERSTELLRKQSRKTRESRDGLPGQEVLSVSRMSGKMRGLTRISMRLPVIRQNRHSVSL